MSDGEQNLWQRIQGQIVQSAQDFYGEALERLKGQLQGDRAQLEELTEQQLLEGDTQARIQDMIDSYSEIEGSLDRAAYNLRNEVAQQERKAGEQAAQGAQDAAGGVVHQVTDAVEQVTGQAG